MIGRHHNDQRGGGYHYSKASGRNATCWVRKRFQRNPEGFAGGAQVPEPVWNGRRAPCGREAVWPGDDKKFTVQDSKFQDPKLKMKNLPIKIQNLKSKITELRSSLSMRRPANVIMR